MPSDLGQARAGAGGDDQLLAVHAAPHLRAPVPRRGGIAHRPEPDRLVVIDGALLAQRCGVGGGRDDVQQLLLIDQRVDRTAGRLAVHPGVGPLAPRLAGGLEFGERVVGRQQVHLRGDQVGLSDATVASDPPLDSGSAGSQEMTMAP